MKEVNKGENQPREMTVKGSSDQELVSLVMLGYRNLYQVAPVKIRVKWNRNIPNVRAIIITSMSALRLEDESIFFVFSATSALSASTAWQSDMFSFREFLDNSSHLSMSGPTK